MEPTVSIHAYRRVQKENEELAKKYKTLCKLINGYWVDTQDVQDALEIDFKEGMRRFDFGRTAKWNKAPLEGQKIITKFRLHEKTAETAGVYSFETDAFEECNLSPRVNPETH
jgi:hypothetical protein